MDTRPINKNARYVVLPCTSNVYDRDHSAVVLLVDNPLLYNLRVRAGLFASDKDADPHLIEKVFDTDAQLFYGTFGPPPTSELDMPDGPVDLREHLGDDVDDLKLEPIEGAHLHVGQNTFFWFSWDGAYNKHGPSEVYETYEARVSELEKDEGSGENPSGMSGLIEAMNGPPA